MKVSKIIIFSMLLVLTASSLQAGELIIFGGAQKPGTLSFEVLSGLPEAIVEGNWGGTFGIKFSSGGSVGYEQNISYSPIFAHGGVHAFQMDSNLLLQVPGHFTPYVSAGMGFIMTWGQDIPNEFDPDKIIAAAYNIGNKFSINYGGGLKLRRLAGPMGVMFDIRGYTIPSARDGVLNTIQMSAGVMFNW